MNFEFFIARRIYGDKSAGLRFSRPAVRIAIAGVAVGLFVMLVSVAVVRGFKREVSGKVIGFGSHIQLLSLTQTPDYVLYPVVTDDSLKQVVAATPGVVSMQEVATTACMLKTDEDFLGVHLRGVGEDYDTTFISRYLVAGRLPRFSSAESSNELLLSRRIAKQLRIGAGSSVFAYFLGGGNMRARRFKVTGVYETHLAEYDRSVCFTDIRTVRKLNNWQADESSVLEITIADFAAVDAVTKELVDKVNHTRDRAGAMRGAFSIREVAPHLFSWLEVLDMNVVMILLLMMAIGAFTIVSGLLIVMLERIHLIGVLKALGATNGQVRRIFRHFAVMLVGQAIVVGDVLALAFCYVQDKFRLVKLDAENYYIDSVPVDVDWLSFAAINLGVLLVSTLVIFGSSYLMSIKGPATTIRWE